MALIVSLFHRFKITCEMKIKKLIEGRNFWLSLSNKGYAEHFHLPNILSALKKQHL